MPREKRARAQTVEKAGATTPTGPKGERAKAALMAAAREVFSAIGYSHARVQDITQAAGFSLGAFYRYFNDKDDILIALLTAYFEQSYSTTFLGVRYDPENPTRSLFKSTEQSIQFAATNCDLMRILWETAQFKKEIALEWDGLREQLHKRITRLITRAQDDGIGYPDLEPVSTADLLIGMTEHAVYRQLVRPASFPPAVPDELALHLTELWAHTLFLPSVARRVEEADRAQAA